MKFWKMHFHGTRLKKPVFCKKVIFGGYFLKIMFNYLHVGRATDLIDDKDRHLFRLLEVMPCFLAWLTLFLVALLSFLVPFWIAIFIIAFDVYWLIKTVYLSLHLRVSYNKLKQNLKINWLQRLENLPPSVYEILNTKYKIRLKSWQDVYHFIFLPIYKEDYSVIASTMEGLLKINYPKSKMVVVMCWEERGGKETEEVIREVEKNYKNAFLDFG